MTMMFVSFLGFLEIKQLGYLGVNVFLYVRLLAF
ncbi:hypothetical protein J2T16_004948 [Paenibacillus intestini]|nr:hypothetical protein [Paenibacillus intestini]